MKKFLLKIVASCLVYLALTEVYQLYFDPVEKFPTTVVSDEFVPQSVLLGREEDHKFIGEKLQIVSFTPLITNSKMCEFTFKGSANTNYEIKVYFSSGASTAGGLEPKTSDEYGIISWQFRVGVSTKKGKFRVVVSSENSLNEFIFIVQ